MIRMNRPGVALTIAAALGLGLVALAPTTARPQSAATTVPAGAIAPWQPRFGRARPVIAVIGENSGTELTDFFIPYGVLAESGAAEMVSVATKPGLLRMRPAMRIHPDATIGEFDARYPQGADYVIVPAVVKSDDPALLAWVAAQGARGATIVSICDGALVVANSGLMQGHRGTAHWATEGLRQKKYPETHWVANTRYVADGRIVSSAGISAAIPTSIALVEAIAGHDKAGALARRLGVASWGTAHNSDIFHPHFGVNLTALAMVNVTNARLHKRETIGVPVAPGVDEIALALTADAWSRTGRSQAYSIAASAAPFRTRHGLMVEPDRIAGGTDPVDRVLPAFDATPSGRVLDQALTAIGQRYGRTTAYGVAIDFEYPGYSE